MIKTPESRVRVRFPDCDPFNHLNNSRYLDYIMTARGDQLIEHYDFDIYRLAREKRLGWVTAQTQIAYLEPAGLMEEVLIRTRLIGYSSRSLHMEGLMLNSEGTRIKALMWTRLVQVSLVNGSSLPHTDEMMGFFREVVYPLSKELSFEERIQQVRQGLELAAA